MSYPSNGFDLSLQNGLPNFKEFLTAHAALVYSDALLMEYKTVELINYLH